jgi:hypothetical protein
MTLSTARVMIITLTLLVLMSWLHFSRFNGVISGGDPWPGVSCGFTPIAGRVAAAEYWTRHCDALSNAVPGEKDSIR